MDQAVLKYLDQFDGDLRLRLDQMHHAIRSVLGDLPCVMCYGIPTFKSEKNIIHFAAFKQHIGLYPGPAIITLFAAELTAYKTSKGAIQFPHSQKLPLPLIKKMTKASLAAYRENIKK
jgi:uncharacterized protein YdhG (YjbR/CyaY superfamily)